MEILDNNRSSILIRSGRPPNFADILKMFPGAAAPYIIFAYAPDIYTLMPGELPPELIRHETVHIVRQLKIGVETWWARYLTDGDFRYAEELLAHKAEYLYLMKYAPSRPQRRGALAHVAKKLAAPLYRYSRAITMERAKKDLLS